MAKLSRRSLFPLAAAGAIVASDGAHGATIDSTGVPGLTIKIARSYGGWSVLVPDFDSMNGYWRPGMAVPTQWMPLAEYLQMIDEAYST